MNAVAIHPIFSQWGRFGLYSFFLDGPEPAIIDTGVTSSPEAGIKPVLEQLGTRIEDVRWILLTHGHIDHIGGAHALWEMTGRRAKVVIHEADAPFLRARRHHVDEYLAARGRYLADPDGEAKLTAAGLANISGEMEPDIVVHHGDELSLGPNVRVTVHGLPGHTAGSVAYVVEGQRDVFVGDAVQIHGAANGFPSYADPDAYRSSLIHLRDTVQPNRLFLGHPYRSQGMESQGVELDRAQAAAKIQESIEIEARVRQATNDPGRDGADVAIAPHAPFCCIAQHLGYDGDPTLEPSPFFTTMHGYFHLGDRHE